MSRPLKNRGLYDKCVLAEIQRLLDETMAEIADNWSVADPADAARGRLRSWPTDEPPPGSRSSELASAGVIVEALLRLLLRRYASPATVGTIHRLTDTALCHLGLRR
jgi:hypothetical protein